MPYVIGENCSTCHYCYNECPVHAIGFAGRDYAIDQSKCIECGKCAEVCPSGIIRDTGAPAPQKHEKLFIDCDVVVIGGGGAGLVAAAKLAKSSKNRVVLLEKGPKCGGNTTLAHGFAKSAKYSGMHEKAGLPDGREKFIEELISISPELDAQLIRDAQYALCDMCDFLFSLGGYEEYFEMFKMEHGPDAGEYIIEFPNRVGDNLKSTDHSMGPGWQTTFAVKKLEEFARGAGVTILRETAAVQLHTDEKGEICGVTARDPGGEIGIRTRACIVATGGFSRSRELMDKLRPSFFEEAEVHSFTVASNTGDGVALVAGAGGVMDWENVRVPMFGPTHHPFHYGVVRLVEQPETVDIDLRGRRFRNEGKMSVEVLGAMEALPGHAGWAILDSNTAEIMGKRLVETASDPVVRRGFESWREQLEEETTFDLAAKKADTLEELAELIGVPAEEFMDEMNRYNAFCEKGEDDDFGKDRSQLVPLVKAPFYACYLSRFNETTMGGILNDTNLNAVRADGSSIESLFVAGDCCRGLVTQDFMNKFGDCAWAMASGYLCAENAIEFLAQ